MQYEFSFEVKMKVKQILIVYIKDALKCYLYEIPLFLAQIYDVIKKKKKCLISNFLQTSLT